MTGKYEAPVSLSFAGHHSRWAALAAPDRQRVFRMLERVIAVRDKLDVLDQAEVTIAFAYLAHELDKRSAKSLQAEAIERLRALPTAIEHLISKFGLLAFAQKSARGSGERASESKQPAPARVRKGG